MVETCGLSHNLEDIPAFSWEKVLCRMSLYSLKKNGSAFCVSKAFKDPMLFPLLSCNTQIRIWHGQRLPLTGCPHLLNWLHWRGKTEVGWQAGHHQEMDFSPPTQRGGTGGCSWFLFYFSLCLQLILILSVEKNSLLWHPGLNFQHDVRISCILLPIPVMNCSAQCLHTVLNIYPQGLKYQCGGRARTRETSSAWVIPGQENGKWQLLHVVERKAQDWNSGGIAVQD